MTPATVAEVSQDGRLSGSARAGGTALALQPSIAFNDHGPAAVEKSDRVQVSPFTACSAAVRRARAGVRAARNSPSFTAPSRPDVAIEWFILLVDDVGIKAF